ncbi:MAG: DivIVA domain-containing protein [Nitrospinota bacterium]|nr:DivIVA domain-containing protein [Nitrospinota bacterium]
MKIAPIDIRQQRFSVKFRGFDPREVDTFLEMVADELEDMVRENNRLKEHQKKLEMQIQELGANEAGVKKTLLAAQTLREDISNNARKEAEPTSVLQVTKSLGYHT